MFAHIVCLRSSSNFPVRTTQVREVHMKANGSLQHLLSYVQMSNPVSLKHVAEMIAAAHIFCLRFLVKFSQLVFLMKKTNIEAFLYI